MHWVHLLSCNCGFDSRREHQFEAVMIEIVIAAFFVSWVEISTRKSLQEMLAERKDVDKFIFAVDTWFEKLMEK